VYGESEFELREGGLKWNLVLKEVENSGAPLYPIRVSIFSINRREEGAATAADASKCNMH